MPKNRLIVTQTNNLMNQFILFLALFSTPCLAQNKEYVKYNKEELINTLINKDKEYKAVKDSLEKLKAEWILARKKMVDSSNMLLFMRSQIYDLKKVIKDNNDLFLLDVFRNKYTSKYFQETELETEDKTDKIKNSNTLINSIKVDADQQTLELSNKALAFNRNYQILFEIRQSVLDVKFDEIKVQEAIKLIDTSPSLDSNTTLNLTKIKMINLLRNYKDNTCLLKKVLDKLKPMIDQKALNPTYVKYEKDLRFKDYPFLASVIARMRKDVNSYTAETLNACVDTKNILLNNSKLEDQEVDIKN